MLPVVQQLLVLQERDQRIRSLQKDLKDAPLLEQRAKSRLADDETAVAAALAVVRDIEIKIKNLELDVQTRRNSIERLKQQQFETRKNEEFQALGHEVVRYENDIRGLEDKELELMEQLENAKPALNAANANLAETKRLVDEEIKALQERSKNVEAQLTQGKAERATLAAAIDGTTLSLYDRLMKSKGDSAVVLLNGEICGGCHVKVVRDTQLKLRADEVMTQCEQCGRILYSEG